jgi:hypothetical protein
MINIHYIRAAIQQATGIKLTLDRTRELLVEEGLITQRQSDAVGKKVVTSYATYYGDYSTPTDVDGPYDLDTEMGLPE